MDLRQDTVFKALFTLHFDQTVKQSLGISYTLLAD